MAWLSAEEGAGFGTEGKSNWTESGSQEELEIALVQREQGFR